MLSYLLGLILINLPLGLLANGSDQSLNLDIKIGSCGKNDDLLSNITQSLDKFGEKYLKPIVEHSTQANKFDIFEHFKDKKVTADDIIYMKQLKSFEDRIFGLQVLTNLLKKSGQEDELLKLAFKIEKFIQNEDVTSKENKSLVQELLVMLPHTFRKMAFGNICLFCLDCYLVAEMNESTFATPNTEQRTFCLKSNSKPKDGAIWKLETKNDGESFLLKNVNRNEYFFAMDENYSFNSAYRKVHISNQSSGGLNYEWILDSKGSEISIQNKRYKENILSWTTGVVAGGKRGVLILKGTNTWQIESC